MMLVRVLAEQADLLQCTVLCVLLPGLVLVSMRA